MEYAISNFGGPGRRPRSSRGDGVDARITCRVELSDGFVRNKTMGWSRAWRRPERCRRVGALEELAIMPQSASRGDDRGQPESARAMNEVACEVVRARPMISGVVGPRTNYWGALAQEQWSCLPHALSMRQPTLHQLWQGASGRGQDHTAARPLRGTVRAARSSKAPRSRRTDEKKIV